MTPAFIFWLAIATPLYAYLGYPLLLLGYVWFVSVIYRIAGHSYFVLCAIQSALGAAACVLTYVLTRRLFGVLAARLAAIFTATSFLLVFSAADFEDFREPRPDMPPEMEGELEGVVRILAQTTGTISDEEFATIKRAGYSDAQLVDISLAIAVTIFTNVFNRINDTTIDFPPVA